MSTKPPIAIRLIHSDEAFFIATRDSTACYTFKQDSIKHDPIKVLQRIAELTNIKVAISEIKPKAINLNIEKLIIGCNCEGYSQKDEICTYFDRSGQQCMLNKEKCIHQCILTAKDKVNGTS